MAGCVLIFGPVSADQMASKLALPTGWSCKFVNQAPDVPGGIKNGSLAFATVAAKAGADPLTFFAGNAERVILGAFSAGHGALEEIFKKQAGDSRLAGTACGDAYYVNKTQFTPKPGYLAAAQRAAEGGPPFLISTSTTGGADFLSASESTMILAATIKAKQDAAGEPWHVGNFLWNDMGATWPHAYHGTHALPDMLNAVMGYEQQHATTPKTSGGDGLIALAPIAVILYFLGKS